MLLLKDLVSFCGVASPPHEIFSSASTWRKEKDWETMAHPWLKKRTRLFHSGSVD